MHLFYRCFMSSASVEVEVCHLAVLLLSLMIELFGARHDILDRGYWRIGESLHDMVSMSLMPLLLWLSVHYRVWRY